MVEFKASSPVQPLPRAAEKPPAAGKPPVDKPADKTVPAASAPAVSSPATEVKPLPAAPSRKPEIGGPKGPEPTRYGDWEKGGRCIDF
jgi:hypothetical protein